MKKLIFMTIMMIGLVTTTMTAQPIAAQPSVTLGRNNLPATQTIDISDVPVVVLNGLNNTYTYDEIEKIEVCTYNNVDIYKFILLQNEDEVKTVYFTPAGVEI